MNDSVNRSVNQSGAIPGGIRKGRGLEGKSLLNQVQTVTAVERPSDATDWTWT